MLFAELQVFDMSPVYDVETAVGKNDFLIFFATPGQLRQKRIHRPDLAFAASVKIGDFSYYLVHADRRAAEFLHFDSAGDIRQLHRCFDNRSRPQASKPVSPAPCPPHRLRHKHFAASSVLCSSKSGTSEIRPFLIQCNHYRFEFEFSHQLPGRTGSVFDVSLSRILHPSGFHIC